MTIKISFIDNNTGVIYKSSGTVTGEEIININKKIYTVENLKRLKFKIVDRTDCTQFNVTIEEMKIIAEQDVMAFKINPDILIALVYTDELQYGMSKVWEGHVYEPGVQTGIFLDRKSADNWIREKLNSNISAINQSLL